MASNDRTIARIILENIAATIQQNADVLDRIANLEDILAKSGLNINNLQDPYLIPKLIGDKDPALVGRYVLHSIKSAELQSRVADLTKMTKDQKREAAKQLRDLADRTVALSKELE
jgi:hypothetical protein